MTITADFIISKVRRQGLTSVSGSRKVPAITGSAVENTRALLEGRAQ